MDAPIAASRPAGPRRAGREAPAILLLCATVLLLLSMISYLRPLLGAEPHLQAPRQNWCGALGFYTAHYLFSFLGLVAALPPGLLAARTLRVMLGREGGRGLPRLLAGMSGIALAAAGLCGALPELVLPGDFVRPGGWLGGLVWPLCHALVGRAGGVIALLALGLLSLMAVLPFSPAALFAAWRARQSQKSKESGRPEKRKKTARAGRDERDEAEVPARPTPRLFDDEPVRLKHSRLYEEEPEEAEVEPWPEYAEAPAPAAEPVARRVWPQADDGDDEDDGAEDELRLEMADEEPRWSDARYPAEEPPRPAAWPADEEAEDELRLDMAEDEEDELRLELEDPDEAEPEVAPGDAPESPAPRRPAAAFFPYGDDARETPRRLADRFMDIDEDDDEEEAAWPRVPQAAPHSPQYPAPAERPARPAPPPPPPPKPVNRWEDFVLPSLDLLESNPQAEQPLDEEHYYTVSNILVDKLQAFGVQGAVVGISPGPVVTTYEFSPAPGVKISRVVALADDLAMVLKVDRVRVVGSIPGKVAIGIEIPNPVRSTVYLKDILLSDEYRESRSKLTLALGFDVVGRPAVANLAKMPHLLIAGATGAGKSVAINAFIASILFRATPAEVRLLMIDPKRIELSVYDDIPHLLHPVVVEAKQASRALLWAVHEMERRYRLLEQHRVKSFMSYNEIAEDPLPYIVVIVDELADLMMVASKDVETSIARLAQMARAAGMHIILATQRPSVDVLTGLIKANFPTRISFKVSSKVDSRTILDGVGAEHLLGMGDMLFLPPGAAKLQRIHGAYISEQETERLVEYLKTQGVAEYDESVLQEMEEEPEAAAAAPDEEEYDAKYDEAVAVVTETGVASISMVQRRLRIGYNRAARMIELMEREGIVGPADGSKPREVLVRSNYGEE